MFGLDLTLFTHCPAGEEVSGVQPRLIPTNHQTTIKPGSTTAADALSAPWCFQVFSSWIYVNPFVFVLFLTQTLPVLLLLVRCPLCFHGDGWMDFTLRLCGVTVHFTFCFGTKWPVKIIVLLFNCKEEPQNRCTVPIKL